MNLVTTTTTRKSCSKQHICQHSICFLPFIKSKHRNLYGWRYTMSCAVADAGFPAGWGANVRHDDFLEKKCM